MDLDLTSIQEARELVSAARTAMLRYRLFTQDKVDQIVSAMAAAGEEAAGELGRHAHEETGFGRPESKKAKNIFATRVLHERMRGMRTAGIIAEPEGGTIWEVAVPMGVVAALIPSTNPTSTAMYKAIISAKARCGIVMSPHPRATECTSAALDIVAEAAYSAGAPRGLFGCMRKVSLAGTNELLEHAETDVILATGGTAMVKAAYSKGKPAYGVGSGNVPVYVDRSADVLKAAADIVYGASFDWGTLCSTERSIVADLPVKTRLMEELRGQGAYFLNDREKEMLRSILLTKGRLNVDQVGKSPSYIARMAGFAVPGETRALVAEVTEVGKEEPLSMETLSPILSFYVADGWEQGCERCIEILSFGGMGHTLGLHCTNDRIIRAFAIEKPAMRIVVNTVAALGSVGYTNRLFPSMTLGPGTIGGSITSDNISPLHLVNVKRVAFETDPINAADSSVQRQSAEQVKPTTSKNGQRSWMDEIENRLRQRAGNPRSTPSSSKKKAPPVTGETKDETSYSLTESRIDELIRRFRR
ncbi:MAG: aldehyde dehydrogenase family protein [Rhodothermia bacterium]|nr:aldehyde dehydrogenase family protein [Rhodothermia bacterium]